MNPLEKNLYVDKVDKLSPQPLLDGDGDSLLNDIVLNATNNILRFEITEEEYTELLSSALNGAIRAYPERYISVIYPLLKAAKDYAQFPTEPGDCYAYPPYAPFISYTPMNPYTNPDDIPTDWLSPPFTIYDGGGSLPPGYLEGDVIIPFSAITLNPFDVFGGQLPTIRIEVVGSGQVELDILAIGNGGLCAVNLNESPSLGDILAGVFSPGTVVLDVNLDTASLPSEDSIGILHEVNVIAEPGEINTIFLTFMPVIDDQLFSPLRFGGGFRSVQLCGFENAGVIMGITDIRLVNCIVETFENGVWTPKFNLNDCVAPQITNLQSQIDSNDVDILNLYTANTSLQSQIDQNVLNIADNLLSIQQHQVTLDDHETRLFNAEAQISNNAFAISNNLDPRITALENAQNGGASPGDVLNVQVSELIDDFIFPADGSTYAIDIADKYDSIEILGDVAALTGGASSVLLSFNNDLANTNYWNDTESGASVNTRVIAQIREETSIQVGSAKIYIEVPLAQSNTWKYAWASTMTRGGTAQMIHYTRGLQWRDNSAIGKITLETDAGNKFIAGSRFRVFGRYSQDVLVPPPPNPLINFDGDTYAYSLTTNNDGSIVNAGNPDNCLRNSSVDSGDFLSMEIDLGSVKTVNDIVFDIYSTNTAHHLWTRDDGVIIDTLISGIVPNEWQTIRLSNVSGNTLPYSVQKLWFEVTQQQFCSEVKIDNITVELG